jgi:hypothetical protein
MKKYLLAGVCAFALCALMGASAFSQSSEVKEKPPMYSYVSNWAIPRAQWGEMDKGNAANQKIMEKALSSGTLVGYGEDVNLVHEIDGVTHDDWWSSMSMAGVINLLEQFYQTGASTTTVLGTATRNLQERLHPCWGVQVESRRS